MIRKFREERGEIAVRGSIGLLLAALLLSAALSVFHVYHAIGVVRELVNESVLAVAAVHVSEFYGGAREADGYARHPADGGFTCNIDTGDVLRTLAASVGASSFSGGTITVDGSYEISGLQTEYVNQSGSVLHFKTTLTVRVPLELGNVSVPIEKKIEVDSSYDAVF